MTHIIEVKTVLEHNLNYTANLLSQSLDEVHIEVETCEDIRVVTTPQGLASYGGPTKYSFIHKVIDGITVTVNTVSITFKSPAFVASVQVNHILYTLVVNATIVYNVLILSSTSFFR